MKSVRDIVKKLIAQSIEHINTTFPAKVVNVGTYTCDVKPKFYFEIEARGETFKRELPVLRGVPVVWPRGGNSLVMYPIKVGDIVLVGCSQFSLEKMIIDLGEVKVSKDSMFDLEGAMILGGFILENEWGETVYGGVDFEIPSQLTVVSDGEILVVAPSINFKNTETKEVIWEKLASDPVGLGVGDEGLRWFNTTSNKFKGWNGSSAVDLSDADAVLHASTHEDGGTDEINVGGLSGELADLQPPKSHTHIDMKSGKIACTSSAWTSVTFNTPFSGSADDIGVSFSFEQPGTPADLKSIYVKDVTVNGFSIWYKEKDGLALTARWIASIVGDP